MAGYTRQDTANNISNGSVIDADDLDGEFNSIEAAFNASTGHSHDGTSGGGKAITKVGPAQDLIVSASQVLPKTTNTLDLGSAAIQYKDAWFDGTVDTDTLIVSGNATVGGTLGVTGAITGNLTGTVSSLSNHNTGALTEGSNLYFTTARARNAISAVGSLSYDPLSGTISYTQGSTDTVAEGVTNLYYTNTRARTAVSATDAGGDGSFSYNSGTGVFTYTGPSATEVRAHFSAGTGVTYSSGQFSIGQPVGTSSNVTFGNVTVGGNLTVSGTTTYINTQTLNIGDNIITLNADETGTPSADAGIEVERGTSVNKSLIWDESEAEWSVGAERFKAGTFEGNLTGNVTGNSTTASTLQTPRTLALGGDLSGSASFNGGSNVTITATVADDSHNHVISNVDGLQTALNGKASLAGNAAQSFSASTVNATAVDLGAWTLSESGGVLYFAHNGTNKMKIDSSGNITTVGNIVAFGTV